MQIDGDTLTLTRAEAIAVVQEDLGYHEDKEVVNDYGNQTYDMLLTFVIHDEYWGLEYYEGDEDEEMFDGHKPDEITCCRMKSQVVQQVVWVPA